MLGSRLPLYQWYNEFSMHELIMLYAHTAGQTNDKCHLIKIGYNKSGVLSWDYTRQTSLTFTRIKVVILYCAIVGTTFKQEMRLKRWTREQYTYGKNWLLFSRDTQRWSGARVVWCISNRENIWRGTTNNSGIGKRNRHRYTMVGSANVLHSCQLNNEDVLLMKISHVVSRIND